MKTDKIEIDLSIIPTYYFSFFKSHIIVEMEKRYNMLSCDLYEIWEKHHPETNTTIEFRKNHKALATLIEDIAQNMVQGPFVFNIADLTIMDVFHLKTAIYRSFCDILSYMDEDEKVLLDERNRETFNDLRNKTAELFNSYTAQMVLN